MDSSKEQIKKILDEAPEGATDWCICSIGNFSGQYGFNGYCLHGGKFTSAVWNQMPLSDLRKQLDEVEWVNGLPPIGVECWFNFKVTHSQKCTPKYIGSDIVVYTNDKGREYSLLLSEVSFSKIETKAEKLERERLESAYELYCAYQSANRLTCMSFDSFKLTRGNEKRDGFLAIVDKTKYRKEVE